VFGRGNATRTGAIDALHDHLAGSFDLVIGHLYAQLDFTRNPREVLLGLLELCTSCHRFYFDMAA
jgi:hypothetical protein